LTLPHMRFMWGFSFIRPVVSLDAALSDRAHERHRSYRVRLAAVPPCASHRAVPGSMYSPKMRLASSTARMSVFWSGLFIAATQLHWIQLPTSIVAPAISSSYIAITTNAVAISIDRPRAYTAIWAADYGDALNVRSWGKRGERHCVRGSYSWKAN